MCVCLVVFHMMTYHYHLPLNSLLKSMKRQIKWLEQSQMVAFLNNSIVSQQVIGKKTEGHQLHITKNCAYYWYSPCALQFGFLFMICSWSRSLSGIKKKVKVWQKCLHWKYISLHQQIRRLLMPKMVPYNSLLQLYLYIKPDFISVCIKLETGHLSQQSWNSCQQKWKGNDMMNANPPTKNYFLMFFVS